MESKKARLEFIRNWIGQSASEPDPGYHPEAQAGPRAPEREVSRKDGNVSIIGIDGLLPRGLDIERFWQSLQDEQVLYEAYPADYLHTRRRNGPIPEGERIVGGMIDSAFEFDPRFFKISNSEAELMDPQVRQLLLSAYRAIEDSGYTARQLAAKRVGVFIGCEGSEYNDLHKAKALEGGYGLNHAGSTIANRISYCFDFKGPSEVINTMCSSAAFCIHRAVQQLRSGEIDVAIVGAAKINFSPETYRCLADLKMTTGQGHCHSFHRDSDGYIRSEGVVTLVLKPSLPAKADGDCVYADIREAVANYNGKDGNSMFAPSKNGQKELIKACCLKAGVTVSDIAFFEAQGMGNEISDFVEFNAINEACEEMAGAQGAKAARYPVITTLKPMLGHMECVSALGALLKVILSFRTGTIYRIPGLRAGEIHGKLDAKNRNCRLLTENEPLEKGGPALAGINSFGASGTNVHLLVEAPARTARKPAEGEPQEHVFVLSAHSEESLSRYAKAVEAYLEDGTAATGLANLCHTFQVRREHHRHRAAFLLPKDAAGRQWESLRRSLAAYAGKAENRGGIVNETQTKGILDNIAASPFCLHKDSPAGCGRVLEDKSLFQAAVDWLSGMDVDWKALNRYKSGQLLKVGRLPSYPFETKTYKLDPDSSGQRDSDPDAAGGRMAADTQDADADVEEMPGDAESRREEIVRVIVDTLSKALKMPREDIKPEDSFADYGVDSITGVNFLRALNEALRIDMEAIAIFDHSSVRRLSEHIAALWPGVHRAPSVPRAKRAPAIPRPAGTRAGAHLPERSGWEPIAIVGMSGSFGDSESLEVFWDHLKEGKDLVRDVRRWSKSTCAASGARKSGYCSRGSFIESFDRFDPMFFNISPLEAVCMDPHQRLFLEQCWKALEDAGYAGSGMDGKPCGVYAGCNSSDYFDLFDANPPEQAFWGNTQCVTPARISYYLNLLGPAITVDTACSSSLVAIHLACQGLWSGETDMALAGGVFLQITPAFFQLSNRAGMLSLTGRCSTFDAQADGFVPAEGVGVVVLKRLKDALKDGDSIRGVIAGSAINQDGKTNGITAPSRKSQEQLELSVYDKFKIHPETIQVVEAHGTGTRLGDPIEFGALSRAFRKYTEKRQFCAIGSVKTNIGHAAAAAGIAGVLKILLALRHRQIPASLHFREGNPLINFEASAFYVNTGLKEWEAGAGAPRRAAINSFGFSGTNAHMVIEEAPAAARSTPQAPAYLTVLSARTAEQLRLQVINLLEFAELNADLSMNDMSYTLFVGRMHLDHRFTCIARTRGELIQSLGTWLETGAADLAQASEIPLAKTVEKAALKSHGNQCIHECAAFSDPARYIGNLSTLADLYRQGYALEYRELFPGTSRRIPLPTYPFARERYWPDSPAPHPEETSASGAVRNLESIEDILARIDDGSMGSDQGAKLLRTLI